MSGNISGPRSASSSSASASDATSRTELPVLDSGVRPERADAARNRLRVLAAAERLFAERGVHAVTMEEVAAAAGVGKGTVYRRFTDKGGLAIALLDERERELQQALLIGAGTAGGDPRARLAAFLGAYLDLLDQHGDLVLMSETNSVGSRFRTGSYHFWRVHVAALLTDAGVPAPDLTAEVILAPLSAENYRHLRARPDHRREDLVAALLRLAG